MTIISLSCTEHDCKWQGKNHLELKGHHVRVHRIQQYRCLVCGRRKKTYKKMTLLQCHLERRHPVGGFRCYLCKQWYRQHDHLSRHYTLKHQPGEYQCPHGSCRALFTTKQAENAHRRFCPHALHVQFKEDRRGDEQMRKQSLTEEEGGSEEGAQTVSKVDVKKRRRRSKPDLTISNF